MMAKVREQSDGLSGQTTRKSDGLTGTNSAMVNQSSLPTATGWRGRIGGLLAPRRTTAQREAQAARPASRWGKLLFGFMVYLLGSFLLQPLILLIFQWLHINPAARQPFFPAGTWVIGSANAYTVVYFVFLAVFIWALFRFNIIPRDPFGARANYQRQASGGANGASGATNGSTGSAGSRASRVASVAALSPSARRHAGRRRLPMTDGTSTPTKARTGFFARARAAVGRQPSTAATQPSAKPAPKASTASSLSTKTPTKTASNSVNATAKPSAKPATSAANGTAKNLAASPKAPVKASIKMPIPATSAPAAKRSPAGTAVAASANANHDVHYDRIKARQRAQRRKH